MTDRAMSNADELLPGDRVRVIDGTFLGLEGTILTEEEARKLLETKGGQRGQLTPECTYVALPLFDHPEVPVVLFRDQIERIGR